MERQNFSDGQEVIFDDHNKITSRIERQLFDTVLFEMMGRAGSGFFQDSLRVSRVSNNEVSINSGLGFGTNVTDDFEPNLKPLNLSANQNQLIPTADPTNDRIDLLVAKGSLVNDSSENRKFKDAFTETISTTSQVVSKKWSVEFQVIQGTPAPVPVAPAVPAGFINLAELLISSSVGIASANDITDKREGLPLAGFTGLTGSKDYDAVVGNATQIGVSHANLKSALDDVNILAGSKILVTLSENVGTIPVINKDDIEIVFKRGVTFTDGGSGVGLRINSNGCKIVNGRFEDFATGVDIVATKDFNALRDLRFLNVTTAIAGLGLKNSQSGSIEE